ncbi:DUF31 family protein [Mycoplasmopsis bovis]|uniref:DUF31 family protein n=2 Tax=Mycoplasmopsis bovis TaxID=28903 RepID=A0A2N8U2F6_MYCBV|nr:DUF31 family protein [Mycoplasmopsis bovis]MBT1317192.1 hypothetical protein [Mycoplasmopsis bovis]MBT1322414.1 hypothetical protein [Mycoplasmopsis bovis]MBT1324554.1 hypothetical protein [Mycoplasmopsis bovis]MBT1326922.1 hypothetical protein [Mycoplasmopsis bovis]MBT1328568.1 hypothetical protein [Mycoplasmopsis bovis]
MSKQKLLLIPMISSISSLVLLTSCSKIENTKITESISENKPDSENNATRESNTSLNDNKDNKLINPTVQQNQTSLFKIIEPKTIYKEIYDRTFALKFLTKLPGNEGILDNNQGTGWLLDYHKFKNANNKYKLFIATNLHVLSHFSNSLSKELNSKLNYYDSQSDKKVLGIALGKTEKPVNDFNHVPNNNPSVDRAKNNSWNANYYGNTIPTGEHNRWESISHKTTPTEAISSPKIVFAALDFMKKEAFLKYQDKLNEVVKEFGTRKLQEKSDYEYKYAWEDLNRVSNVPMMVDFGIFEIDVDLDKADETLKQWVKEAIDGVDNYLSRLSKTAALPNQNKDVSKYLQTVDYVSAFKTQKHPNNLTKAKDVYIAGYPVDGKVAWWMQNNPSERYKMQDEKQNQSMKFDFSKFDPSKPFPILPHNFPFRRKPTEGFSENNVEEKISTITPTIFDSYWGRVLAAWYGFQYNVNFSSLYYGASWSLAYNEYGQMIGIYNGVSSNVKFGDLLKNGSIAPFLQSSNIEAGENTIYAYNLIDGTNKTQFGMQKNSFRENLRVIYPNGFEDGSKETKLFDKGY